MRSDIVSVRAVDPQGLAAWRELAATALVPNPFAAPEFVLPAARWLRAPDAGLLVVRDGSSWRALLPVRTVSRWRHVPARCLTVWRHVYCYLGTPLLAPEHPAEALAAMLRRATREPGTWAFILEWVDHDGPFGEALADALTTVGRAPVIIDDFERALLHRRPPADDAQAGSRGLTPLACTSPGPRRDDPAAATTGRGHHRTLLRLRRRLEARVGALSVRDHAADESAPRRFLDLENSGWKGRAGTAMASDPDHARMFVEVCAAWRRAGHLELLALEADGCAISMKCNARAGASSFCFKAAFDEQFAKFSPGSQLELANIDIFNRGNADVMDSCTARDNLIMNQLWAHRRRLRTLALSSGDTRGAVGHAVWRAASAWRDASQATGRRYRDITDRA